MSNLHEWVSRFMVVLIPLIVFALIALGVAIGIYYERMLNIVF